MKNAVLLNCYKIVQNLLLLFSDEYKYPAFEEYSSDLGHHGPCPVWNKWCVEGYHKICQRFSSFSSLISKTVKLWS